MRERPPASNHDLPALDATELLCLDIDMELTDVWEQLDQMRGLWDDLHLAVVASAMRVAFARGRRQGGELGKPSSSLTSP
jgi:hypothetical protein